MAVKFHKELEGFLPFRQGLFVVNQDGTGYLVGNKCQRCGVTFFPKREFCTECFQGNHLDSVKLDTKGTLYTFTIVHRATPDFEVPYTVGYIDLEKDGVRIFAPITDCRPEELKIGVKMELVFGKRNKISTDGKYEKQLSYQFRPSK